MKLGSRPAGKQIAAASPQLTRTDAQGVRHPVVLVHGGGFTSQCYQQTAEGLPGWAPRLVDAGYEVYLLDWPGSDARPDLLTGNSLIEAMVEVLSEVPEPFALLVHSMSGPYGYRLVERMRDAISALIAIAPGPPGNIQPHAALLAEDQRQVTLEGPAGTWVVPKSGWWQPTQEFLDRKLIGDSTHCSAAARLALGREAGPIPWRLLYERQNVHGSQLVVHDTSAFVDLPALVVTGDRDSDHSRETDAQVVEWLRRAGAAVRFSFLDDPPLTGNGHMLMSEDNSDDVLRHITHWLERTVTRQT